jgi:uncharacterized protein
MKRQGNNTNKISKGADIMSRTPLDRLALVIVIIGALNWLLFGLFQYDLVASIFGGQSSFVSRTIYTIVGLAGLYSISLLFREAVPNRE